MTLKPGYKKYENNAKRTNKTETHEAGNKKRMNQKENEIRKGDNSKGKQKRIV